MSYDANYLVRKMRADADSDWPIRLLARIADAPTVAEKDITAVGHRAGSKNHSLTSDEVRVLECLARGMTRKQAGDALFMAIDTIKEHLKLSRYKLRAKNTTHACCEALRLGVIR